MNINQLAIEGIVGKGGFWKEADGEKKACISFSLGYGLYADGERFTAWSKVLAFGKTAELLQKHVHEGDVILVTARLGECEAYKKRDGTYGASVTLIVNDFKVINDKPF